MMCAHHDKTWSFLRIANERKHFVHFVEIVTIDLVDIPSIGLVPHLRVFGTTFDERSIEANFIRSHRSRLSYLAPNAPQKKRLRKKHPP